MVHSTVAGANIVSSIRASDSLYTYDSVPSAKFVLPGHIDYRAGPAGVAHSRTVGFLRSRLGGPIFRS